jgi:hypothetical protein
LAITHGDPRTLCIFGGTSENDLERLHYNTARIHKWANLLDHMLDTNKRNGHCDKIDSAYMGDIIHGRNGSDESD